MAKTNEELNKLKEEYETLTSKLKELNEDELMEVTGGDEYISYPPEFERHEPLR